MQNITTPKQENHDALLRVVVISALKTAGFAALAWMLGYLCYTLFWFHPEPVGEFLFMMLQPAFMLSGFVYLGALGYYANKFGIPYECVYGSHHSSSSRTSCDSGSSISSFDSSRHYLDSGNWANDNDLRHL